MLILTRTGVPFSIAGLNRYWLTASTAFSSRPLPDATHHRKMLRQTLLVHDDADQDVTALLCLARLPAELRIDLVDQLGWSDRSSNPAQGWILSAIVTRSACLSSSRAG